MSMQRKHVVQTNTPHLTREGFHVHRRRRDGKLEPVFLKYEATYDSSKKYPYSSTRQNTRMERFRIAAGAKCRAA